MKSIIEWLDWNEEVLREVYKEYIEKIEADHSLSFHDFYILVIYKAKDKNEKYKMTKSEVAIWWSNNKGVVFYSMDISSSSIIAFCPMSLALPHELL